MKYLLAFTMLIMSLQAVSQARTGIYITNNLDLEICDHKMKLLNAESVFCLSQEPIIEPDSFQSVGKITFDSVYNTRRFKITLTPKGAKRVNTIAAKLPDHKLAVVVDGVLVSVLNLDGIYNARVIVIWDEFDSHSMDWIHKSLNKLLAKGTSKS